MDKLLKFATTNQNSVCISRVLCAIVDEYMDELRAQSPFFHRLRAGEIGPEITVTILETTIFALRCTPVHLQRAEAMAREINNLELALFFKQKAVLEYRHEDWAMADLHALPCADEVKRAALPVPGVIALMDFLWELIRTNPLNYLAYIFTNEHISATVVPEIIKNLSNKSHIDRSHLTVLTKHSELDQLHSAEDEAILDKLFGSIGSSPTQRQKEAEFIATIYQSLAYYEQMFSDFLALSKKSKKSR